jgi:hypothetical protein
MVFIRADRLSGEGEEGIPQGLKPVLLEPENTKAEALVYLEAKTKAEMISQQRQGQRQRRKADPLRG